MKKINNTDRLYDRLIAYSDGDYYPMHMPGHKRNNKILRMDNPYMLDITEIEGFDNLHQAQGILKTLSQRICRLYGAGWSFPLINGSTAGILAGISAAAHRGDKVLIARNAHKSVYHGVMLMGLRPVYIYPPQIEEVSVNGGISPDEIEALLIKNRDIRLVVITSPTYEGIVSDIHGIAKAVHRQGATLLVDEAHGAHFGFHESFPVSAVTLGADLVIQSLHKTLPSFTQTAVLHSNREDLYDRLQKYLAVYQSSSPSYLLMAGMDRCISMLEDQSRELFNNFDEKLRNFNHRLKDLERLKCTGRELIGRNNVYDTDPSKITISVRGTGISGHELSERLRNRYRLEPEMAAPDYVLAMTSICDTQEGFDRLANALLETDRELEAPKNSTAARVMDIPKPEQVLLPSEAIDRETERIKLKNSAGRISASYISLFPPGSPLIIPGEKLGEELINHILRVKQMGIAVTGLTGALMDEIDIIA